MLDPSQPRSSHARSLHMRTRGQVFTPPDMAALMAMLARWALENPSQRELGSRSVILDPACGDGALLVALAEVLERTGLPEPSGPYQLVGVELESEFLRRCEQSLSRTAAPFTLHHGDALAMRHALAGQCDVVIANPPYVAWQRIEPEMRAPLLTGEWQPLKGRPNHADQQPDLALFFLQLGLRALRPGGRLIYLLPPEWLSAPRVMAFRDALLESLTLEAVMTFAPGLRIFDGDAEASAQSGAMVLLARKSLPGPSHTFPWMELTAWGNARTETLHSLACALTRPPLDLLSQALRPVGTSLQLSGLPAEAHCEGSWCEQSFLRQNIWQPSLALASQPDWVPLERLDGIRVVGGSQPRVEWLRWLELDLSIRDELPPNERWLLKPALSEVRPLNPPIQPSPTHGWVMFPGHLTEPEAEQLAPRLLALVRNRYHLHRPAESPTAESGQPLLSSQSHEQSWWRFPNPRNLTLFEDDCPGLLLPRTAPQLLALWDAHACRIKGTNTAIRALGAEHEWKLYALFGLLNSEPMRRASLGSLRSYHGRGVRLEPRDVASLKVPSWSEPRRMAKWRRLSELARRVVEGLAPLDSLHSASADLLEDT